MKHKGKMRKKFFKYFSLCIIIPAIVFTLLASVLVISNDVQEQKQRLTENLTDMTAELERLLQEAVQVGNSISEDRNLQEALPLRKADTPEFYRKTLAVDQALFANAKFYRKNLHVYLIGENGGCFKSSYLSLKNQDFTKESWYQCVKTKDAPVWFDIHEDSFVANSVGSVYVSLGIPIHSSKTQQFLGLVLVEQQMDPVIHTQLLEGDNRLYVLHPDTELHIEDGLVQLYRDNAVVSFEDGVTYYEAADVQPQWLTDTVEQIPYWKSDFSPKGIVHAGGYYISYAQLDSSDWILVSVTQELSFYRNIFPMLLLIALFVLFEIAVVFLVSARLSDSVSNPIEELGKQMAVVKTGNFDVNIPRLSDDEIGDLSEQFNSMVRDIKNLMTRIYEEQQKLRSYELMLLQAQINPHFLYNTLDSLMWLIRMNQGEEALKMTTALTAFFSTGLNKGSDIISLGKELENVRSYLTIQQLRYPTKLHYVIHCQPEIEDIQMPKLILQPFVENSLYHGIKKREHGGTIEIQACRSGDAIVISVVDDGLGMPAEMLEALRLNPEDLMEKSDHYGIQNVKERLRLFYRENYDFDIQSTPDVGTCVMITIREEGQTHV